MEEESDLDELTEGNYMVEIQNQVRGRGRCIAPFTFTGGYEEPPEKKIRDFANEKIIATPEGLEEIEKQEWLDEIERKEESKKFEGERKEVRDRAVNIFNMMARNQLEVDRERRDKELDERMRQRREKRIKYWTEEDPGLKAIREINEHRTRKRAKIEGFKRGDFKDPNEEDEPISKEQQEFRAIAEHVTRVASFDPSKREEGEKPQSSQVGETEILRERTVEYATKLTENQDEIEGLKNEIGGLKTMLIQELCVGRDISTDVFDGYKKMSLPQLFEVLKEFRIKPEPEPQGEQGEITEAKEISHKKMEGCPTQLGIFELFHVNPTMTFKEIQKNYEDMYGQTTSPNISQSLNQMVKKGVIQKQGNVWRLL